jgi:hypothetical protein
MYETTPSRMAGTMHAAATMSHRRPIFTPGSYVSGVVVSERPQAAVAGLQRSVIAQGEWFVRRSGVNAHETRMQRIQRS